MIREQAVPVDAQEDPLRQKFADSVARHGLKLSAEQAESTYKLASWMHKGLSRLGTNTPVSPKKALDLDIFEQGRLLRNGSLTSLALLGAHIERIAQRDPSYRAFYVVDLERALAASAKADAELKAGQDRGPLHGIPVGIKDLIDIEGLATTADAPGRKGNTATGDAAVVKRLRDAGAILLGKLATYEWGTVGPDKTGLYPPARNPWNLDHITGGSSSGGAAALAGGLLRTTVGTDTGGSLRGPSFYCGVVGLKPTFGLVPNDGVLPLAQSMDHIGPMSASVAEAAVTLDVLTGLTGDKASARHLGRAISGQRIGYARNWFATDSQTQPAALAAMDAAMSTLSELGALIEEIELPDYAEIEVVAAAILHRESFDYHAESLRAHEDGYGKRAYLSLIAGVAVTDDELAIARRAGQKFTQALDRLLERYQAIVTIGALTTALPAAPFEKEAVWTPMRTIGFNVSGHPVLALPIGFDQGLPLGMQIIGRHHDEAGIVQVGHAFERATDHSVQRPPAITA